MDKLLGLVDHLVYCVHDLEKSIDRIEKEYGLVASVGGRHLNQGTRNALINIGNGCYLELLTIDNENDTVTSDRWMGIDLLTTDKITRWAMKSMTIDQDKDVLSEYKVLLGEMNRGMRQKPNGGMLRWDMTVPASEPEVEVMPFMIDWSHSDAHPVDGLSVQGQLQELRLSHPEPERLRSCFDKLDIRISISEAESASIRALIEGPNGLFEI